jgi:hypothetical protein
VQLSSEVFAARRAEWLAELSAALGEARRLVRELDVPEARIEAMELCVQIDALRREVDAMRLKRSSRDSTEFDPEWINSPWHLLDQDVAKPAPPSFGAGYGLPIDA